MKKINELSEKNIDSNATTFREDHKTKEYKNISEIINKEFVDMITGNYDAINYKYSIDSKKEVEAFIEGFWWMTKGYHYQSIDMFDREPYVMLLFAQELYMKALLAETNVASWGHEVDMIFSNLSPEIRKKIIKKIEIQDLSVIDKDGNEVQQLQTFDDYIKYISKYFITLRYDFEKIDKNEPTTIPRKFINDLTFVLYSECYSRFSYATKFFKE